MKNDTAIAKNRIYPEKTCYDFKELVANCTNEFNDNIAFTIKDKNKQLLDISFLDFSNNIKELATGLLNLGLSEKKIAIISPDRYEWCCCYFAIASSNNITVPLDYLLTGVELTGLIEQSQADAVIFDIKYLDLIKDISARENSSLKYCICLDYEQNSENILSYSLLLKQGKTLLDNGDTRYDSIIPNKDKMAVLIYTSGTASKPKAVVLSQYNICSNLSAMTTLIKHYPGESTLVFLPLHHTLACLASFIFCYYVGFRIYFADSIKDIGKNMKEYQIAGFVSVPAVLEIMYRQIIKGIKKSNKYFSFRVLCVISNILMKLGIDKRRKFFKTILDNFGGNLRTIIYGSASSEKEVIKLFNTIGIDMIQGYGLTETSPVIACENDKYHDRIGSCGFPLHNLQVKIDNPDSSGIGEIIVKGPNVMLGYYENEEATRETIRDGWLYTGDLGKLDQDGYLYVTGRKKDLIVLQNGKKVFPHELEALLNKCELIEESMIYEKDQKICAEIVYSKDNPLIKDMDEQTLHNAIDTEIKNINQDLPVYKYIREFILTDIPLIKTTTQKIRRSEEMKKIINY